MNYFNTLIAVAPDTKAKAGVAPTARGDKKRSRCWNTN
jgi:hypothetical protein